MIVCFLLLVLLLLFPGVAHEGADIGVALFMDSLFPYLLAYLILTSWLLKLTSPMPLSGRLNYLKIYILSALGGFPTGASIIAQLKERDELSERQASILLGICHCPSPLFVIGFVGQDLLGDTAFSVRYLILLHVFSLILLFFLPVYKKKTKSPSAVSNAFTSSIKESVPTVLVVGSTIIFFSTIYTVLFNLAESFLSSGQLLFLAAALEMTNGLHEAHTLMDGELLRLVIVLFLTMQSLSIHLQVAVIAKSASIPLSTYVWMRLFYSIAIPFLYFLIFI
ncbi:hypothetical protein [Lysinibacillus sp. 3P01SB]|uniref:hypothetical protein n=1 Tax=Lysinibacillus sp. 3P01SB TaxID=3132284 RepID=UPI0039A72062